MLCQAYDVLYRTLSSYPDLSVRDKMCITFPALRHYPSRPILHHVEYLAARSIKGSKYTLCLLRSYYRKLSGDRRVSKYLLVAIIKIHRTAKRALDVFSYVAKLCDGNFH